MPVTEALEGLYQLMFSMAIIFAPMILAAWVKSQEMAGEIRSSRLSESHLNTRALVRTVSGWSVPSGGSRGLEVVPRMRTREIASTMSTWSPLIGITVGATAAQRSHPMWDRYLDG